MLNTLYIVWHDLTCKECQAIYKAKHRKSKTMNRKPNLMPYRKTQMAIRIQARERQAKQQARITKLKNFRRSAAEYAALSSIFILLYLFIWVYGK